MFAKKKRGEKSKGKRKQCKKYKESKLNTVFFILYTYKSSIYYIPLILLLLLEIQLIFSCSKKELDRSDGERGRYEDKDK